MFGVSLAIISAAIFGFQNAAARRAVVDGTPLQGILITVPPVVPLLFLVSFLVGGFDAMFDWTVKTYIYSGLAGIMHFVIGRNSNFHSMRALGSILSTPIQQLSTVISLFLAIIVLNESFTGLNVIGIVFLMIGPAILIGRRNSYSAASKTAKFVPNLRPGVFHGLICIIGYGASPILIVLALQSVGPGIDKLANSTAILFFSYFCASFIVLVLALLNNGFSSVLTMKAISRNWFIVSGVMIAVSQVFRYGAFAFAPVSVVVPIQRLSIIFRLIFNVLLNRDYERFDLGIVLGILLSILGAVALGADTRTILDLLKLEEPFYSLLNWRL